MKAGQGFIVIVRAEMAGRDTPLRVDDPSDCKDNVFFTNFWLINIT